MKVGKYNVTPTNILNFLAGTSKKILDDVNIKNLPDHEIVQILLRAHLCKPCLDAGHCLNPNCNCKTPDMFYAPDKECEDKRWGKMMNEEEWNNFSQTLMGQIANSYAFYTKHQLSNIVRKKAHNVTAVDIQTITFDFGNVETTEPLKHEFELVNNYDRPLQIKTVTTSCGCTIPMYSKEAVNPGEKYTVTLQYDNKSDVSFTKHTTITYQDDSMNPIKLVIKGTKDKEPLNF